MLKFAIRKSTSITGHAAGHVLQSAIVSPFIAWNVSTIRLLYFPQVTTYNLCLLINSEQITAGHG